MSLRRIATVLLLAQFVHADYKEDLEFARRLGARGLEEMAYEILSDLEKSSDPAAARAGRYGRAVLERQQASIKRYRYLRDLEEGIPPRVSRDEVLAAFADAKPKIEDYVTNRADDLEARFLLAELLQEHAEFLTGKGYPDALKAQREQLMADHAGEAESLFKAAIGHYDEVSKRVQQAVKDREPDLADPLFFRLATARYKAANAVMRWALLYPKGPKFINRSEEAIEKLDEFMSEHYEDIFGAFAMLDLGEIYFESGLRKGDADEAETGINYYQTLFTTVPEDPSVPDTTMLIAQALYGYARACNALAQGEGAFGKPQPVFYENTIRAGTELRERLKQGSKHPFALRALLEVAEAYAAQDRLADAVAIAGEVLASARVTGERQIGREATMRLTNWVARVAGSSVLDAALLFQIGESLANQGRTANAVTFYEKAIDAAGTEEERERWAYPALVRIAKEYRKDQRFYASAMVADRVVQDYLKSGEGEETAFGQIASDACNTARLCWKEIAELTKRPQDDSKYRSVLSTFRDKFPGHPENSDQAFAVAREFYSKEQFEQAASALADINPTSRNYWLAQRMVPACYRRLATDETDAAQAKQWHEKTLTAAENLIKLTSGKRDDPQVEAALKQGEFFVALALSSLERWADSLRAIDAYLAKYPDPLVHRGLEYLVKIDAHLALGQLDAAEAALATMLKRAPAGSLTRGATYNVFRALREKYESMDGGSERVAVAGRAAVLLELWLEAQKDVAWDLKYLLGQVLFEARRFGDAAEAYESSADLAPAEKKQQIVLLAAEAKYRELETSTMSPKDKVEALAKVRELFTDVLIPPDRTDEKRTAQRKVLEELAGEGWPRRETFEKVKRNPRALYVAARIYSESSPTGIDGRQLALRLIHHLHSFTIPTADPDKETLHEFIPTWWDGAELRLNIHLAIAQSGTGPKEKDAAKDGYAYARKLTFQYTKMDGPERVAAVQALEAKLKTLAPR